MPIAYDVRGQIEDEEPRTYAGTGGCGVAGEIRRAEPALESDA